MFVDARSGRISGAFQVPIEKKRRGFFRRDFSVSACLVYIDLYFCILRESERGIIFARPVLLVNRQLSEE